MKQDVAIAIQELERAFPSSAVCSREDGNGGAYAIVEDVAIGKNTSRRPHGSAATLRRFTPTPTSIRCSSPTTCVVWTASLLRLRLPLGSQFLDRSALQVSRRNNHTQHYPQTCRSQGPQGAALPGTTSDDPKYIVTSS